MTIKPYKYKLPSKVGSLPRLSQIVRIEEPGEELSGWVNGLEATDLEERFARELRKKKLDFQFQFNFLLPDRTYKNTIDFVIDRFPIIYPVEIYGQLHEGNEERDERRLGFLNEFLIPQGLQEITVVWYWQIETPERTQALIEEKFL